MVKMNKEWNLKYFEKSSEESHINIHRSLEIENYYKQLFKKTGFNLFNIKLNFTTSSLTILLFVCVTGDQQRKKNGITKNSKFGFLKNSLRSVSLYLENKFNLILKIKNVKSTPNNNALTKTLFNLALDKFKIPEIKKLYFILATQKNSTELLGNFIAKQLRITKRHNFFFSVLNKSLMYLVNQKNSKVKGLKISIAGRLNNALRSQSRTLQIGQIPLTTINTKIEYVESTSFTANGTIGVKVWLNRKNI